MRKRAAKEAQVKLVAAYATARMDLELDEEKARSLVDTRNAAAANELAFDFLRFLVAPKSRLMIPRPLFDDLRHASQAAAQQSSAIQLRLQRERRSLEQQNANLQADLRALRRDFRALAQAVELHCRREQSAVLGALQDVVAALDGSIASHRAECAESPAMLNRALEDSRLAHREFAQRALDAAAQMTAGYGRATFAHTKIPPRIRNRLRQSSVEDLLLLLDTLSFEDGALQYLLHKFPPNEDCPLQDFFCGRGGENEE